MQDLTIMGHFLEDFKQVDDTECPSCSHMGICGYGVRTNFELIHPNASNRYQHVLIADEYHICTSCQRAYVLKVDVIANEIFNPHIRR